jgi:NAD(P)-dependent dehydrogenase (short-subunit alcohol dehydrogenase family)
VDINLEAAQKGSKLVADKFPNVKAIATKADVSKEADIKAAVDLAIQQFGRLDVMVCLRDLRCWLSLIMSSRYQFNNAGKL